jgi:DNA-binding NarL/FixJ family response regulator
VYFSPRLAVFVLESFRGAEAKGIEADHLHRLTRREREVLRLVAAGYTYQEIGARLSISARTVETHAAAAPRKLRLSNRRELSRWASARHLT